MIGNDFVRLGRLLKNIDNIEIDFVILSNGEVFANINENICNFRSLKKFIKDLEFLRCAKFSSRAFEVLDKEKTTKKKEFFLYWLGNCVNYGHQKWRTLEDLREEFNNLYGLEIKQGRKKKAARAEGAQICPNLNESKEEV